MVVPFRRPAPIGEALAAGIGSAFERVTGRWADSRVQAAQARMLGEQRKREAEEEMKRNLPLHRAKLLSGIDTEGAWSQLGGDPNDPIMSRVREVQKAASEQAALMAEARRKDMETRSTRRGVQNERDEFDMQFLPEKLASDEDRAAADRGERYSRQRRAEEEKRKTELGYEMQDDFSKWMETQQTPPALMREDPLVAFRRTALLGGKDYSGITPIKRPPRGSASAFNTQEREASKNRDRLKNLIASNQRRIGEMVTSGKLAGVQMGPELAPLLLQTAKALSELGEDSSPAAVAAVLGLQPPGVQ